MKVYFWCTVRYNEFIMKNTDRLMNAALNLFSLRGYNAVGVQEIVDSVSLSKPTLYHYFGSKYGLLEAILRRGTSGYLQTLQTEAIYDHDLTLNIQRITRLTFEFIEENRTFYRFWASLNFAPEESEEAQCNQPIYELIRGTIQQVFESAEKDHGNMAGRAEIYTANYMGMLSSVGQLIVENKIKMDEQRLHMILHQFEHGIYS